MIGLSINDANDVGQSLSVAEESASRAEVSIILDNEVEAKIEVTQVDLRALARGILATIGDES